MYVPMTIMVAGDPAATAQNIVAHESLFRIGIVSNLISQIESYLGSIAPRILATLQPYATEKVKALGAVQTSE